MRHSSPFSTACLNFIKQWQGLSLERYKDHKGCWVIGYGHEITADDQFGAQITAEQAEELLHADLSACIKKITTSQLNLADGFQMEALLVLIFSSGVNRFLRSGILPFSQPENV